MKIEDMHVASVLAQVEMSKRMEVFEDAVWPHRSRFSKQGWRRILSLLPKPNKYTKPHKHSNHLLEHALEIAKLRQYRNIIKAVKICTPFHGSCALPSGHKGWHQADPVKALAIMTRQDTEVPDNLPFTLEWKENGRWCRSSNTFMTKEDAKEHAECIGARTFRVIESFPDRIILGTGFPWATGLGRKKDPYKSIMMLRGRKGVLPKALKFPKALWSSSLPQYRLVLERINKED